MLPLLFVDHSFVTAEFIQSDQDPDMKNILSIIIIALLVSLAGCDSKEAAIEVAAPEAQVIEAEDLNNRKGTVVEFSQVSGYTYALVENNDGQQWFAGPTAELEAGQTVYWNQGAVMNSFNSKALGKTFESITFIDRYLTSPSMMTAVKAKAVVSSAPGGEVISVQEAIGYIYLEIQTETGIVWVAAPTADIKAGDQVEWSGASLMRNFSSKTLDRSFSEIYFVAGVVKVG